MSTKAESTVSPLELVQVRPDIREEMARIGPHQLSEAQLIALILRCGTARHGVLKLAQDIHKEFGLTALARLPLEELQGVGGLGPAKAASLVAAFELGRRVQQRCEQGVTSAAQALTWFQDLAIARKESFRALYLDGRRQVLRVETISIGTLTQTLVHPREVFQPALLCLAAAVIVGHNHPSGDPTPSSDDFAMTDRLVQAGSLLGIEVLDHVIIGRTGYRSLRAMGRIACSLEQEIPAWAS